jgi:hypothetical protein
MDEKKTEVIGERGPDGDANRDLKPNGQQKGYVVLSDEERAKGFVRPVRDKYIHVGRKPKYPLRDLTFEEMEQHGKYGYVKFEEYPESERPLTGRYWTQKQIDGGCGVVTTMGWKLAETYARDPSFYSGTFCCGCGAHFPVGEDGEFVWDGTDERVGT